MQTKHVLSAMVGAVLMALSITSCVTTMDEETEHDARTRLNIENEVPTLRGVFDNDPSDENRFTLARSLFELGDVWEANDVIAPIATASSEDGKVVLLGARLALMTMDLDRAESLFRRALKLVKPGSEDHQVAARGLAMSHYQREDYSAVAESDSLAGESEQFQAFREYLREFGDDPYQIEWTSEDRTGHMPFTNDITVPGVLPEMDVVVNGEPLSFLLDTGGDRLYLDSTVSERAGVEVIRKTANKYAYTQGEYVDEILGRVETFEVDGVRVHNVPVHVTPLRARGQDIDGIVTTQFLKQFLSTIDYERGEITLRERGDAGKAQYFESMAGRGLVGVPFFMAETHLMFAKGTLNGHTGMNMFLDSGLASAQEVILANETSDMLGLDRQEIAGTPYYISPLDGLSLDGLEPVSGSALGNVFVEEGHYWRLGFAWDALISHQYLWRLGSWTIDFGAMAYYFPSTPNLPDGDEPAAPTAAKIDLENPAPYIGGYEVQPGFDLEVTAETGVLYLTVPGQSPIGLEAYADGTFGIPLAGAVIEFEGDPAQGITGLVMTQGANVTRAVRK